MNKFLRENFLNLKVTGQRAAMSVEEKRYKDEQLAFYLQSFIMDSAVTDFEDLGFCYWNISDSYALLRNGRALLANHQRFYKHVLSANQHYLYWIVSDATQRLALEREGYSKFWWSLYRETLLQNRGNLHSFAAFSAHRAALYSNPALPPHKKQHAALAISALEQFLDRTKSTNEFAFYEVVYLSLVSHFEGLDTNKLEYSCRRLFHDLSCPEHPSLFLPGEWKGLITPFSKRKQSIIGINSAVNALIDGHEIKTAKELYHSASALGLPKNHYIETRL